MCLGSTERGKKMKMKHAKPEEYFLCTSIKFAQYGTPADACLHFDPAQKKIDLKVLIKLRWGHVKSIKENDHMCR